MQVKIRFIAMEKGLPGEFTEIELEDNACLETLKKKLVQKWGGRMTDYWDDAKQEFKKNILIASGNRLLQDDAIFSEGQEISIIGQIIGG